MTKTNPSLNQNDEETLKNRLFYLLTNCPLLAGRSCAAAGASAAKTRLRTVTIPADEMELVSLHITLPYKLRQEALAAGINCSELMRKALKRQLKKAARQ
ncbi:hypothetical protein [uncultured Phascolarctobacterium sp.]|jgi:post-segregation antitoxin (ccd killing protein)|uniref:hypothetical protein n=1 Tax=uncultured Phascolarctobacterium sp. TaxID=512296 RepID=UPI0015AF81E7|nr:hypothetical protein [uncultured Phascolarctobacterium sp.]